MKSVSYLVYIKRHGFELLESVKYAVHDDDGFVPVHADPGQQRENQQQPQRQRWRLHLCPPVSGGTSRGRAVQTIEPQSRTETLPPGEFRGDDE